MLSVIKNTAIVVRISDFVLNSSLRELTRKGPPIPNKPCEMPPSNSKALRKSLGNFMVSKKITLAERIIERAPKLINSACELTLVKIKTPIMVPRRQMGSEFIKTFLEKDL